MYLQHQASRIGEDKKTAIFFFSICLLYILSTVIIAMDTARYMLYVGNNSIYLSITTLFTLSVIQDFAMKDQNSIVFLSYLPQTVGVIFGICDFIAQSILVRINSTPIVHFHVIHSNQRFTVAGLYGIAISVS